MSPRKPTKDWCFSGNFRKLDSDEFHHLFRHLTSSKRLTTQGLPVFQALLHLFPWKALPQKRCLRATSNPSLESGPDSCQLGTQAREGLGGVPVENLGIRFQNLRKLWFNLRYCFVLSHGRRKKQEATEVSFTSALYKIQDLKEHNKQLPV